jgi:hypothetical protein
VVGAESTSGAQSKADVAKVGALYSVEAIEQGNNLVYNPSFEIDRDGDGVPDGWQSNHQYTGGGVVVSLLDATYLTPRHGTYGAHLQPNGALSTNGGSIASKPFRVIAGDRYRMTVDCNGRGAVNAYGLYFRIMWYNQGTDFSFVGKSSHIDVVDGTQAAVVSFDWGTHSGVVKAPAGAIFARIGLYAWTQRNGYGLLFDNLRVYSEDIVNSRGAAGAQWLMDYNNDPNASFSIAYTANGENYTVSWGARTFRNAGALISVPAGSFVSPPGVTWYLYWDGNAGAVGYSDFYREIMGWDRMYLGKVALPSTTGLSGGGSGGGTTLK